MRRSYRYDDAFDELDFDGIMAVRHTSDNRPQQERRLEARKRRSAAGKNDWLDDLDPYDNDDDYGSYDTGDTYNLSEIIIDNH